MARPLVAALALAFLAPASHADNCEPIRAGIETRIRNSGVPSFTLSVVPAEARVPGRVVGTCARGTRKIVYVASAASPPAPGKPARDREPILTECKDGSTSVGGDCRK